MSGASPSGDRAGVPSGLSPQAVSSEAAHPLRGPCAKLTTTATIIAPNGQRFVGTNFVNSPQLTCPREGMATGVGYHLCKEICDQPAHAEVNACLAAGERARGGTLYLEGHYYACDNCKRVAAEHGVEIVIGPPR